MCSKRLKRIDFKIFEYSKFATVASDRLIVVGEKSVRHLMPVVSHMQQHKSHIAGFAMLDFQRLTEVGM